MVFQLSNGTSSRLLDRIATLNFNVIRCAHEHPLKAQKYLNGGKVRVVISPNLQNTICDPYTEQSVVKALKEQFKGRLHDLDLCQIGFFNYKKMKLGFLVQAVQKSNEGSLSEDIFTNKNNIYWVIIGTAYGAKNYHSNRIQKVKSIKRNSHE
tara:strand:- start:29342 stop:29800 length:459 start_codon:yes stop_codon:yes gene_type:complete